ncbi:MAG: ABC transporter ATP-binding protein [Clostridia bacterium]|nr:ABC transporter ATP-binding protein [Clostridia bacterium]
MIRIEQLKKTYDRGTRLAHEVLHGLSFDLPDTGFVCILGASGCGKTSLLNAIGGLDVFDSGKIITETAEITRGSSPEMERERNANFGYIFQNYYLLSEHSAAYNVFMGMHSMPLTKKEKMLRVKDALARVDMLRYRKRPVGELSGGQQQRVAIARAIARRPRVIFADEPTGNLDEANTMNICTILKELSRESLVIMVTHEERIARFFADRIITLSDGQIASDSTDWTRGTMDAGAKDTLYAGDYAEKTVTQDEVSLRVLTAEGAAPVALTVIAEADRIVIKVDDPRIVLCSEATAPRLVEGKRPILNAESLVAPKTEAKNAPKETGGRVKKQLELSLLMSEVRTLVSGKKLRRFGTGLFIILLSLILSLSMAYVSSIAHIEPEDFITTDSHTVHLDFGIGEKLGWPWNIKPYMDEYLNLLSGSGLDFDMIPVSGTVFEYVDSTFPQYGSLYVEFPLANYVNVSRLDEETLILGRMPETSTEVVIDRWVVEHALSIPGILQNVIPDASYFLGRTLDIRSSPYAVTVVGICDSGEPDIYMSTEALVSIASAGTEIMTLSEFRERTGYSAVDSLGVDECIVLTDYAGSMYRNKVGYLFTTHSGYNFTIVDVLNETDDSITAKIIISDEGLEEFYRAVLLKTEEVILWCADKAAMHALLAEGLPEEMTPYFRMTVTDAYATAYNAYKEQTMARLDAKTIVAIAVTALALVMLYLMQRSKIRERMDLIAVYRLLGIPKRNLLFIFCTESLTLTLKYALPTVLVVWGALKGLTFADVDMYYPIWVAGLTLLLILACRLLIAALPVLRLLRQPPAKLAAKYDF